MAQTLSFSEVQLGAQGRLVIPAPLRKALGLQQGDCLVARLEGKSLVLERRETVESHLWAMFEHIPPETSLVEELLAERRAAVKTEG